MISCFTPENFTVHLDALAGKDLRIREIIQSIGYPPFWDRPKGFEGLVRIILEQQVSLSSAFSVFKNLKQETRDLTPETINTMPDDHLRSLGITRQKTRYIKLLAKEISEKRLDLNALETLPDQEIRTRLTALTGIGPWTADIYLIMGMNRLDIFPVGDLALRKAMKALGFARPEDDHPTMEEKAKVFAPYRSMFSYMLWHWYICENKIKVPDP